MQDAQVQPWCPEEARDGWFGNTDWWIIRRAGKPECPEADSARTELCLAYWKPVFRFIRKAGRGVEDSQDLTQEFFARLLEKNALVSAVREKGKFRSFLLTLLKRFLADQWDREHCQKRGGGRRMVSLDSADTEFRRRHEPVDESNPERICERNYARSLFEAALGQLQRECAANGTDRIFEGLKSLVICEGGLSYAAAAQELQLSESNVKVIVYRLRQRLQQLLRDAVEQSGTPRRQVDLELHDLCALLIT